MPTFRQRLGALVYDVPRFVRTARRGRWPHMRNRNERTATNGRGIRCDWEFTSDLHIGKVFPAAGRHLMRVALEEWPIGFADAPRSTAGDPEVTFVIGHRGRARLPHLLMCLRSIAATEAVPFECIVVEQSFAPEIAGSLPPWVRHVHTPAPAPDYPYNRAWTLNVGARLARGSVVVLHDNDMLVPRRYASELALRVRDGAHFLDLKRFTFYLDEQETRRLFDGAPLRAVASTIVQNLRGASVAARRDSYFAIGGFDEEFVGWGGEDNDFWDRAEDYGTVDAFGYLPFVHLWHEPQPGKLQGIGAPAVKRYYDLRAVPPRERTARLRGREIGRLDRPASER